MTAGSVPSFRVLLACLESIEFVSLVVLFLMIAGARDIELWGTCYGDT